MRKASSTACTSNALRAPSTERSRRFVCGSIRFGAPGVGHLLHAHGDLHRLDNNHRRASEIRHEVLPKLAGSFARVRPFEREPEPYATPPDDSPRGDFSLAAIRPFGRSGGRVPSNYPGQDGPGPRTRKPSGKPTTGKPAAVSATRFVFPVVGRVQYTNDYGAPRPQGAHEGNDIMAPRRALAVATEAGKIKFWTHSATAGCMLYLYGKSGTTYLYIHLNNDVTDHNDNRGKCAAGTSYAPGLKNGANNQAGQLLGFVGDSGDANGVGTHPHFEVHPHDGGATNPYPYLKPRLPAALRGPPGRKVHAVGHRDRGLDGARSRGHERDAQDRRQEAARVARRFPDPERQPLHLADGRGHRLDRAPPHGPSPAASTVSLARLTAAKKGQSVTVTTAPASTKLEALLGRGLFDAATVVLKPT